MQPRNLVLLLIGITKQLGGVIQLDSAKSPPALMSAIRLGIGFLAV